MARRSRRLRTPLLAALAAAVLPSVAVAAPSVSFDISPISPLSGEPVEFSSTSTEVTRETWDLDDDGDCDDGVGSAITRSFATPDPYDVTLCAEGEGFRGRLTRTVTVRNRPPAASFVYSPTVPIVGQTISLTSLSTDADSAIARQAWDLDGDAEYDDGVGIIAAVATPPPGVQAGRAQGDRQGGLVYHDGPRHPGHQAAARAARAVPVRPHVQPLHPHRCGDQVLRRPTPARLRCDSALPRQRCPYRRKSVTTKKGRAVPRGSSGASEWARSIEVFVTKDDAIGKYTRFRIRRGREPGRVDGCLFPGNLDPGSCPFD